ncbi:hypothetical protein ACH5RR_010671 [Cinchona calisaya]|uniref:Uncharacterized protein n=1 Tax=Cinchona calisaya TaxID=153742 RepID=A0ABD3AJP6_9GENT
MGRKPKSAKAEERAKANANENFCLPLESMKDEQRSFSSLPSKKKSSEKASTSMKAVTRKSGRLRSLRSPMSNQEMMVEEIDLADTDKEEDPLVQQSPGPRVQQLNSEPLAQQFNSEPLAQQINSEPVSNLQSLEDKIDFLVQSVKEFKSQGTKSPFRSETHSMEINYRTLYIDSQKKIEALTEENHQLAKKLEFASGKAEAFEQIKDVFGNLKDMVVMTNMARATEAFINLSSQTAIGKLSLAGVTTAHDAAAVTLAANEHNTTSPPTRKKYERKRK